MTMGLPSDAQHLSLEVQFSRKSGAYNGLDFYSINFRGSLLFFVHSKKTLSWEGCWFGELEA